MSSDHAFGDPNPNRLALQPWAHEGFGCLGIAMDSVSRENWLKIATNLERSDSASSWFYARAKAIAEGRPDPLAELDGLRA